MRRVTPAISRLQRTALHAAAEPEAPEICGMSRAEFLLEMGRRGIPIINLDAEELKREFRDA